MVKLFGYVHHTEVRGCAVSGIRSLVARCVSVENHAIDELVEELGQSLFHYVNTHLFDIEILLEGKFDVDAIQVYLNKSQRECDNKPNEESLVRLL